MADDAQTRMARSAKLQEAIKVYLDDCGFEGMLGDWILVSAVVRVDPEGEPDCQYSVALSNGSMLQHIAIGLLSKGVDTLEDCEG
jgi:hypothetical protein